MRPGACIGMGAGVDGGYGIVAALLLGQGIAVGVVFGAGVGRHRRPSRRGGRRRTPLRAYDLPVTSPWFNASITPWAWASSDGLAAMQTHDLTATRAPA